MVRKSLLAAAGVLALSIGCSISCNKSSPTAAAAKAVSVAGTWYAKATVVTTQVDNPDTFSTRITITGNTYVMMRSTYIHASSTGNQDTMMEYGIVSSIPAGISGFASGDSIANGDSIVLTPDSSSEYMFNTATWEPCTGLYCPTATPERFKVHIVDSAGGTYWDDSFPDFKGEGWILPYLKKQ